MDAFPINRPVDGFFRMHVQLMHYYRAVLPTPRSRLLVESFVLLAAVLLLSTLVQLHSRFVPPPLHAYHDKHDSPSDGGDDDGLQLAGHRCLALRLSAANALPLNLAPASPPLPPPPLNAHGEYQNADASTTGQSDMTLQLADAAFVLGQPLAAKPIEPPVTAPPPFQVVRVTVESPIKAIVRQTLLRLPADPLSDRAAQRTPGTVTKTGKTPRSATETAQTAQTAQPEHPQEHEATDESLHDAAAQQQASSRSTASSRLGSIRRPQHENIHAIRALFPAIFPELAYALHAYFDPEAIDDDTHPDKNPDDDSEARPPSKPWRLSILAHAMLDIIGARSPVRLISALGLTERQIRRAAEDTTHNDNAAVVVDDDDDDDDDDNGDGDGDDDDDNSTSSNQNTANQCSSQSVTDDIAGTCRATAAADDASLRAGADYGDTADLDSAAFTLRHQHFTEARVDELMASVSFDQSVFEFAPELGFLQLSESARHALNISTISITVDSACLGGARTHLLLDTFSGYESVLLHSFSVLSNGTGYLCNEDSGEVYSLAMLQTVTQNARTWVGKVDIALTSVFLVGANAVLVGVVLREAQNRALQLAVAAEAIVRQNSNAVRVGALLVECINTAAWFLVLVGMVYFLADFLDDHALAILVYLQLWLLQLFSVVSIRCGTSLMYWARFIGLFQFAFYTYVLLCPYTFAYLAFVVCALFSLHVTLFFYNRFEIPGVESGLIAEQRPRQVRILHRGGPTAVRQMGFPGRFVIRPPAGPVVPAIPPPISPVFMFQPAADAPHQAPSPAPVQPPQQPQQPQEQPQVQPLHPQQQPQAQPPQRAQPQQSVLWVRQGGVFSPGVGRPAPNTAAVPGLRVSVSLPAAVSTAATAVVATPGAVHSPSTTAAAPSVASSTFAAPPSHASQPPSQ
ncbi:hypothetical protein CAOG_05683 [Capsaspora owczarzaki ATCC 30864]|uniref:Uncharacterized protein n=1 Tax=Capsaspora owczarzaki (strain ATCC 30864) TaxID=595528 RepID=A0A0D2VUY1_CAPO3|nr:hypothetical protein CAOG_05683 [Capsaspora owczarzaki ATCC 30864]KJE95207.1 hypothetical protein CAOG_005683 [Capsaspora owczarzaki ATCC 30864]|eukprot:XP_004346356.2 hypothetical protein CAOG_05683 [Capsaspora owczarzaki ATCC 30864]